MVENNNVLNIIKSLKDLRPQGPFSLRFAPTPSGYLHEGNALNFILISKIAKELGTRPYLRIDDSDQTRYKSEYYEDIYNFLEWMELPIRSYHRNEELFRQELGQWALREMYKQKALELLKKGEAFCCLCSRKELKDRGGSSSSYDFYCQNKGLSFRDSGTCVRLQSTGEALWSKDGHPSYLLCSVVDDLQKQTDLIIRGPDLRPLERGQIALAQSLKPEIKSFPCKFIYHAQIRHEGDVKLSKSTAKNPIPLYKKYNSPSQLFAWLERTLQIDLETEWSKAFILKT